MSRALVVIETSTAVSRSGGVDTIQVTHRVETDLDDAIATLNEVLQQKPAGWPVACRLRDLKRTLAGFDAHRRAWRP